MLYLLVYCITLQSCTGQTTKEKKEIYNKTFNWTIAIPENFDTVSIAEWSKMQNRGAKAIENTYDTKVENNAKTIFVFRSDQFNYFESNYQPFDTLQDGDYLETSNQVNQMLYGTFEAQMPNAKFDSASSTEAISGLTFQKFTVSITFPNNMVMEYLMYHRLFGKKAIYRKHNDC